MNIIAKCIGLLVAVIVLNLTVVEAQSDIKLAIDAKLPRKYVGDGSRLTTTAAAQLRPYIDVTIGKVDYLIAYEKETRKIKYIYTDDDDFRSSEGLKVDDEITVLWKDIDILGYFQLRAQAGRDGWQPVIAGFTAFEGKYLENLEKAGKITTEIDGFAKGYN